MVMLRRTAWLFVSYLAIGCSGDPGETSKGPNRAPVIDGVEASAEIASFNGQYVAPIKVLFHDEDGDVVNRIRLRIPQGNNFDDTTTIQGAVAQQKSATLTLELDAATVIPGTYEYLVTVFDTNGIESEPVTRNITFK